MINISEPDLEGNEIKYVLDCIKSSWISSIGSYVKKLENEFSEYVGCKYGIATSSGTSALHLALLALNINKKDEVIIPTLTFIATANAVNYTGAKPVFVDSDKKTWNLDTNKLREALTKKTKAIIPVHLYGHPCNIEKIMEIANKNNLYVIEDAAEAHGAEFKRRKVGSFGDISCFSFYGNKIMTTGEGGMCLTNDKRLAKRMRLLRDHSMSHKKKYWHTEVGYNYRLTNLQAAIGLAQLEKIEKSIETRRNNAKIYDKLLSKVKGITLPSEEEYVKNVYWLYSILVEKGFGTSKYKLVEKLRSEGIETRPVFYPIHTMPPYRIDKKFPIAEEISRKGLSLPSHSKLTENDIKFIVSVISNN